MTNKTEDRFYFGKPGQPERFGYSYRFANILADDLDLAISEIQKDMKQMTQVMQKAVKKNPLDTGWIFDTNAYSNRLLDFIDRARGVLKHKDARVQAKAKKAVAEVRAFIDKWDKMEERARSGKAPFARLKQQERFGAIEEAAKIRISDIQSGTKQQLDKIESVLQAAAKMGDERAARYLKMLRFERKHLGTSVPEAPWHRSSRPGQPERFGLEDACWEGYEPVGTKQKDGRTVPNCVPKDKNEQPEEFAASGWQTIEAYVQVLAEEFGTPRGKEAAQVMLRAAESLGGSAPAALRNAIRTAATSKNVTDRGRAIGQIEDMIESASFSRPGQPDKFDASSLDRSNFAEASKSPILGKLLAAKVMPDGGWRAVQVGSDTLVISFEDADLARDFGRRASTKGYSATSPVATTGRYWNVEVKNG